jgi:hypothetical protein
MIPMYSIPVMIFSNIHPRPNIRFRVCVENVDTLNDRMRFFFSADIVNDSSTHKAEMHSWAINNF